MYDIGIPSLAGAYDPAKVAKGIRTSGLPKVDCSVKAVLKRVKKDRAPKQGDLFEFKFEVQESNSDKVVAGACYTVAFFPRADDVSYDIFWRNITPLLMAVRGETNISTFNALEALGELLSICDGDDAIELDLPFRLNRAMEPARPQKDGTYKANHLDKEGKPKMFSNDTYSAAE